VKTYRAQRSLCKPPSHAHYVGNFIGTYLDEGECQDTRVAHADPTA